jgi:hypothetical protein
MQPTRKNVRLGSGLRLVIVPLAILTACSKPNNSNAAQGIAVRYHQELRTHTKDEVDSVVSYVTHPMNECRVPSCDGYAPIDCQVWKGWGTPDTFRARNLKDCYQVHLNEEITYKNGCLSDVEADYEVVIGKSSAFPIQSNEQDYKGVLQQEASVRNCSQNTRHGRP